MRWGPLLPSLSSPLPSCSSFELQHAQVPKSFTVIIENVRYDNYLHEVSKSTPIDRAPKNEGSSPQRGTSIEVLSKEHFILRLNSNITSSWPHLPTWLRV